MSCIYVVRSTFNFSATRLVKLVEVNVKELEVRGSSHDMKKN
jgi:hypothetical protein